MLKSELIQKEELTEDMKSKIKVIVRICKYLYVAIYLNCSLDCNDFIVFNYFIVCNNFMVCEEIFIDCQYTVKIRCYTNTF